MGISAEMAKINEENSKIDKYVDDLWAKIEASSEKIRKLEAGIERYKERMNKVKRPHWTDALFTIKSDMERISGMEYKASGNTLGIGCGTYINLVGVDGDKMYLCIVPKHNEADEMVLEYETGETASHYQPGTIGAINGLNNVTAPLPDTAEEIFAIMKKVSGK